MTIDAETTNQDAFRGLVLGAHSVDTSRQSAPRADDGLMDVDSGVELSARAHNTRPQHVPHPKAVSSSPSIPPTTYSHTASANPSVQQPSSQPPRYRRECRVRYKRTVFPARLQCTWRELAALGAHGRQAVWIEGDGPPPGDGQLDESHDENASLRVVLAPIEGARTTPKEVAVPPSVRSQLGCVSCVAFEDSTATVALATLDGRVMLLQFA